MSLTAGRAFVHTTAIRVAGQLDHLAARESGRPPILPVDLDGGISLPVGDAGLGCNWTLVDEKTSSISSLAARPHSSSHSVEPGT